MQTIVTRFTSPYRVTATASGNRKARASLSRIEIPEDIDAHRQAVEALCKQVGWTGSFIGGHLKDGGMVWVFDDPVSPRCEVGGA